MTRIRLAAPAMYGAAALAVVGLHLATSSNLGFHTDELYYMDSGRHLAFGYVDFPPVVPLLARIETDLLGATPFSLRLLPSLLGGFLVVLWALYVRRLGGSLQLQGLALVAAIAAPFLLGSNWVFQTVTFDQVTWMIAMYWLLCLLVDGRPRYWVLLGLTLGVGLEVKYTIAGLVAGIVVAVLVTPALRRTLRTRHPWIGAVIGLLVWAPNLGWQVAEGFPTLSYVTSHSSSGGGPLVYLVEIAVYFLFLLPLWIGGLVSLLRSPRLRPIAIASLVPLVLFLFVGKSYYAAGTIPLAVAQGLIVVSRVQRPRLRRWLKVAIVTSSALEFLLFFFLVVPVTPPSRLHSTGLDKTNEVFADSVGWSDVAHQVTAIYEDLPATDRGTTAIISAYYGVPGALRIYSDPSRIPAVISPQLSDWYWLPMDLDATSALMVDYRPADVKWMCDSPRLVAHLTVPYQVKGLEQGAPVTLCRLKMRINVAWGRLRNFS